MTATLGDVTARERTPEPSAKDLAAAELVRLAKEQGLSLTGPGGLLKQLTRTVLETALNEEMTGHLGYEKHDPAGGGSGNIRNGSRSKTVLSENTGPVQIDVPRDRAGSFEPQIVRKRQRRLSDRHIHHRFPWRRGRVVDLMAGLRTLSGHAEDINNAGEVVGTANFRPVLWRDGRMIHVAALDRFSVAVRINERGDVAGRISAWRGEQAQVFRWRDGRVLPSAPARDGRELSVYSIDEHSRVVGTISNPLGIADAVVWAPSRSED